MNIRSLKAMAALCALWFSAHSYGHSGMFPDGFEYDDSNEGAPAESFQTLMSNDSQSLVSSATCVDGSAAGYPCKGVDLMSFMAKGDLGGGTANLTDIWGWTDPQTGAEIAIVARTNGTSFVDVTDAANPVLLGFLPSHNNGSDSWRDVKTYNNHAYIVGDGSGNSTHGLQVFDLTTLSSVTPGTTLTETAHMGGLENRELAHALTRRPAFARVGLTAIIEPISKTLFMRGKARFRLGTGDWRELLCFW